MSHFEMIAAAIIAVVSTARGVRLITHDKFPPTAWLREKLVRALPEKWGVLFLCPYCLGLYAFAIQGLWAWQSGLNTAWWVINGWAAGSYFVAMVVAYDGE